MFLHDINYEKFDIAHGDTLIDPAHWDDEPFEAIVSNPPYSIKWEGDANPLLINDPRYAPAGVLAPKSKADLAFTMHMLSWLAVNGTAAIVEFPGVLYRGGAEQKIRKYSSTTTTSTRSSSFRPTSFSAPPSPPASSCSRSPSATTKSCSSTRRAEFVRNGNKNKLTEQNQRKILDAFIAPQERRPLRQAGGNKESSPRTATTSPCRPMSSKEDTREAVDITGPECRDRQHRRAPSRVARPDRRHRGRLRRYFVSRIDDLILGRGPVWSSV